MKRGIKCELLDVDPKGRVHLPMEVRKLLKIEGHVIAEIEEERRVIKPTEKIDNPLAFLYSINAKTKKSPVEMKREAEEVLGHEALS